MRLLYLFCNSNVHNVVFLGCYAKSLICCLLFIATVVRGASDGGKTQQDCTKHRLNSLQRSICDASEDALANASYAKDLMMSVTHANNITDVETKTVGYYFILICMESEISS